MNKPAKTLLCLLFMLCGAMLTGCGRTETKPWHTIKLSEEFTVDKGDEIRNFEDYLALEERLFEQLDKKIYAVTPTGPEHSLQRYSTGSISDPRSRSPDWNRSFQLHSNNPIGTVLLLHGMTDSPYSLRAIGERLNELGYEVLGLRLPGHGTAPSAMKTVHWQDMAAATRLAVDHLRESAPGAPLHIIGYSTGAALALDFVLDTPEPANWPASLVLISPAVGVTSAAALASWKRRLSLIPGLGALAWSGIDPEFDPYKYNSFATNAGEQVYLITRRVAHQITSRQNDKGVPMPPVLVLKSAVDATVSTDAVVDRLLNHLEAGQHELVLFDINRFAPITGLMTSNPGPLTRRMLEDDRLPFSVTFVGNLSSSTRDVSAHHKPPYSAGVSSEEPLGVSWPAAVFSLSHVALPFPPDDPLYGQFPPDNRNTLFLGTQVAQGERDVLRIAPDFLMRLRHNPFYAYQEKRIVNWLLRHRPGKP